MNYQYAINTLERQDGPEFEFQKFENDDRAEIEKLTKETFAFAPQPRYEGLAA